MSDKTYNDIRKDAVVANDYNLLIVTATETETKAFHEAMPDTILRVICGDYSYHLGQVGQYNIIHVQCLEMGSLSSGGSAQTVNAALKEWPSIKAVIMVGICFGFNKSKQKIGDVVVSSSVKNYETRRVGKTKDIPRGKTYQADKCLLNAFNNLKQTWENIDIENHKKGYTIGEYVSGEQLVDNEEARNKLLAETPEAKAGEMEGNGLAASCVNARIPWILVKAICDFADGNKGRSKKKKQAIAAASAARCCEAALGQATAFESINISCGTKPIMTTSADNSEVLFEIYKKECEPFFLRRSVDSSVQAYLASHSLWVYGLSGVGKSTSILHALMSMGKEILLINMSGITQNSSLEGIFEWMYYEVANYVGDTSIAPQQYQLCARRIVAMLDQHFAGKSVYVLVEEIPFSGVTFETFVTSFSSMVISNGLSGDLADVHFVLSSIDNPKPHLSGTLQKTKSMVKFLEFEQWSEKECQELVKLIVANLTVPKIKDINDLITKCEFLPRSIKTVFREVYHTGRKEELDSDAVEEILKRNL